jgi:hypothetical protein
MDAGAAVVARLRANGLTVTLTESGRIRVRPRERITPEMDRWIRARRAGMLAALQAEQASAASAHARAEHAHTGHTEVPNVLLDYIMPTLGLAERAVLLYLVRRLTGFHKESDAIALGQISHGITTRDGDELDWGTGISRSNVQSALATLVRRGYVEEEERPGKPSRYRVHVDRVLGDRQPLVSRRDRIGST